MPRQADPATAPRARVCLYPTFRISGYAMRENAAAAAIETPVTAAKTVFPASTGQASALASGHNCDTDPTPPPTLI